MSEDSAHIEDELGRAAGVLAAWKVGFEMPAPRTAAWSRTAELARRPEAFFDLASFVETMRSGAQVAGVLLQPGERFGFGTFVHEAPAPDQQAEVLRELRLLHDLLDALMDAQPRELLSVQRKRRPEPGGFRSPGNLSAKQGAPSGAAGSDYFEPDARLSLRVPGVIHATAFRLAFTGHTAVLRRFLDNVAAFDVPAAVRSVDVTTEELRGGKSRAAGPLVEPGWSHFVVTVEFVTLADIALPAL